MIDIKGQQFGRLTVIEFSHLNKTRHAVWKCKCDCGEETTVESRYLRNGQIKGCGCLMHPIGGDSGTWKGCGELSLTHFNKIRHEAKRRGLEFQLDIQFLWELFLKQNGKCALSGDDITFRTKVHQNDGNASLDRIDSSRGYFSDNVQWVHKDLNLMKWNLSTERFLEIVGKVYKHFNKTGV